MQQADSNQAPRAAAAETQHVDMVDTISIEAES
jgi:hypothetical protein